MGQGTWWKNPKGSTRRRTKECKQVPFSVKTGCRFTLILVIEDIDFFIDWRLFYKKYEIITG